jgi:hypothetical protein
MMTDAVATTIWLALAVYMGVGGVIALGVVLFGLKRLTPTAVPLRVRLLILPGLAALWPVVVWRFAGVRPPEDRA